MVTGGYNWLQGITWSWLLHGFNSRERLLYYRERQETHFLDLFLINTKGKKTSTF